MRYEPAFAKARDGVMYRLEYLFNRAWLLSQLKPGQTHWDVLEEHNHVTLRAWGRTMRERGEERMVLELGILMSGSEETRLRRLGCEIRLIAEGIYHTTEGGIGTSWNCWHKARAWAELEPDGGFRIVIYTIFIGGELEEYCSHGELFTVDDVIEHVDSLDFGLYVVDYGPLEELAEIRDQLLVPYDGEKGSKN